MNCCESCFSSDYLRNLICKNSTKSGTCTFCGKGRSLIDSRDLEDIFLNIIEMYELGEKEGNGLVLQDQFTEDLGDWIFSKDLKNPAKLLHSIFFDNSIISKFLSRRVNSVFGDSDEKTELLLSWEALVSEIRETNRFHLKKSFDLDHLGKVLSRYVIRIPEGKKYYRARISSKTGYKINEMWNPPIEKATAGRANPPGISYLYLSQSEKTTLKETRAALWDYVTIAEFELKKPIEVINLNNDDFDPVLISESQGSNELLDYLVNIEFTDHLQKSLSKPKRRDENELKYLPTQYLSEFIKYKGFAGIEFESSQDPKGINLAAFYKEDFDCLSSKVVEIRKIELEIATT